MNFLKKNANPEEIFKEVEEAEAKRDGIKKKIEGLKEKKRKLVLAGKDVTTLNEKIARLTQEMQDIIEILIPELNKRLIHAKIRARRT